ncbi:MAG: histidine phosphatase family protein [Deltaproteobacteria bacterium]|nr:histidine phosphatase family protein [Deltaproteobacteria bacterium]
MQLYVIRHGIAEDSNPAGEAARELTSEGRKKLKKSIRGLRELGASFDRVLTSPWTRALATATMLEALCDAPPVITDLLAQPPRAELLALIAERGQDTAVVGHEPWLSELVAWLTVGEQRRGDAIDLRKGGVIRLDGEAIPHGMKLQAHLPPKVLRALA